MWFWLACAEPPPPVSAPQTHSWAREGQLVVDGLEEAERLYNAGQRSAAATFAERVYTDRWEPRLEGAMRETAGGPETTAVEYAYGQLIVELEGGSREAVAKRIDALQSRARSMAEQAAGAFPPPGETPVAERPKTAEIARPIIPDVPPNWERDEEAEEAAP